MYRLYSILFIIFAVSGFGQELAWPTGTGKELTSNFGEFRKKHFHMGLDIRTNSSTGHPMYAVSDGYLYRITTNFKGYGKALYLKTIDGNMVLYGHLDRYTNQIEDRLFDLQNSTQSYYVNKYFLQDEYQVARGDIIAYSGNSGGSTGPHLHFEFRNEIDQPLNPMTAGFPINDSVPPTFLNLSIIPITPGSHIENSPLPFNIVPELISSNNYVINDTIATNGTFGFAAQVIDKIQTTTYSYQIETLELFVDSISTFSVKYDLLDFSEGNNVSTVYGQPVTHAERDDFQKLYRLKDYPKLTIHADENNGLLDLTDGLHKIEIVARDAESNRSVLTFFVQSHKPTPCAKSEIIDHISFPIYKPRDKLFTPEIIQFEQGVLFKLQADSIFADSVKAYIQKSDEILAFALNKIDTSNFVSELNSSAIFEDDISYGFLFYSDSVQKYELDYTPELILPNSIGEIYSTDSISSVSVSSSFYDTTLFWIAKHEEIIKSKQQILVPDIYELQPYGLPYKNDITVSISVDDGKNIDKNAIYTFNSKKSRWEYEQSTIDTLDKSVSAKLSEPNIFAAIIDTKPPEFLSNLPLDLKTYTKNELSNILIKIDDNLSGIDYSEQHLQVYVDGQRIWVAYQPFDKEISYTLRNLLAVGEHNLLINIQDRSGNSASKSIKFFIE